MWDLSAVVPSFLILIVLVCNYFKLPSMSTQKNRSFLMLIGVEMVVIVFDMLSSLADMNYTLFPLWLLYFLNGAYFVMFMVRTTFFFGFSVHALRLDDFIDLKKASVIYTPADIAAIIAITSPWTKLLYYIDDTGYHSGPLYYLLYAVTWFYIFMSLYYFYFYHKNLDRSREYRGFLWFNALLFAGTILRKAFPSLLIMDTFCILAIAVIYLNFANPDFNIEGRTYMFNSKCLREYLKEHYGKKKFHLLIFSIHNYRGLREIYGVSQMDVCIRIIGEYLKQNFKKQRIFYYRSGRFVILGDESFDRQDAYRTIKNRFAEPWISDESEIFFDIGGASFTFGNKDIPYEVAMNMLIASFEKAYESEGSKLIVIEDSLAKQTDEETRVKRALEHAIDNNGIEVFLQPIINSENKELEGAEALCRIRDENGNIIPPGLFIPIAEKNGRISQLGDQVFTKTCKFISETDVKKLGLNWINVNLSPIQFMRTDIADFLAQSMSEYNVDPDFIHLEITEEAMIDDQLLQTQMHALITRGFRFALDDYGRGYSNMSRLKKCPFINIKLDMSIVRDYCNEPDEMLPSMVETFRKMGFYITAEGIETEDMAEKMTAVGCRYLQGYLYSKPIPMDEFVDKYMK